MALAACASAEADGTPARSGQAASSETVVDECASSAKAASGKVEAAVEANGDCRTDDDCTSIDFATSCFDSCTRAVAKSGLSAVAAAKASADANQCAPFAAAGCRLEVPACAPSLAPTCKAGRCT